MRVAPATRTTAPDAKASRLIFSVRWDGRPVGTRTADLYRVKVAL